MRTFAAGFAVLALATPALASPSAFDETEHVSRTIPLEPGGTLRLKNFSGRVTITASDRPEVVIDAVRRASRSRLDRISSTSIPAAPAPSSWTPTSVTTPGAVSIREKSWEANPSIDVDTFSGNIELRLPDTARGSVSFSSFSGHLNSEMPLTLHSSRRQALRADLGGGGGGGELRFSTFSGSVKIDR